MMDNPKTPAVGRIDLGQTEPRYLTPSEQRVMDAALRRSHKIIPDPEIARLRVRLAAAEAACTSYYDWEYGNGDGDPSLLVKWKAIKDAES